MENEKKPPQIGLWVLEETKKNVRMRDEIAREINALESQIRQSRHHTHANFMERIAAKTGIDLTEFMEEGKRRNKIEKRILEKGFDRIRIKTKRLVQEEFKRRQNIRKSYLEIYNKPTNKEPADPELKFCVPVEGAHWTECDEGAPGGMVGGSGCHEPSFSERAYSDEMVVGFLPPEYQSHHFYPRAYAATGDDDDHVHMIVRQNLTLRHDILEPGRGDFDVNRIRVNIFGAGYSERRDGESCPILLHACGLYDAQYVRLKVKIFQTILSGFLEATLIQRDLYTISSASVSEPIVIESGTETFPCDFRIFNPDSGGSEPWVLIILEIKASACNEGGRGEIDFSRPEFEGLELGCVSLFGDYV